ncbi:hypothetical protein BH09BAC5_BH09BAC5_15200 [soil metagenome]
MRIRFFLTLVVLLNLQMIAQKIDYKTVRDSLSVLSCGKVDSSEVVNTRNRLENFDTTQISKNIYLYYRDLQWCYYRSYLVSKDSTFIDQSIINGKKSLITQPYYTPALWDITFCYFLENDCENGKYYLEEYKKSIDKKYRQQDQINRITAKCGNN